MTTLVTGATGKVGNALVVALLDRGERVRTLVRDPLRAGRVLPAGVELAVGDVTRPDTLAGALEGCEIVFNAMGIPEQWLSDAGTFERVNAAGTEALVRAAGRAGVRRVVHTSTVDVFTALPGASFDESSLATTPKRTAYARSKQLAEERALAAASACGVEVVIVNPAGVYGPGPGGAATSIERKLLAPVARGQKFRVPFVPPGGVGLVYAPGLADGQLLAAAHGRPGERYIFCDGYVSFADLAAATVRVAGRGFVPPILPLAVARAFAAGGDATARLLRRPPLLTRDQLRFILWNARPQPTKACRELGWRPTPLDDGIRGTLEAYGLAPQR